MEILLRFSKRIFCLESWKQLTSYSIDVLVLAGVIVVPIWQMAGTSRSEIFISIATLFAVLGFAWWIASDARKSVVRLRQEKWERKKLREAKRLSLKNDKT